MFSALSFLLFFQWEMENELEKKRQMRKSGEKGERSKRRQYPHAYLKSAHCMMSLQEYPVRMFLDITCKAFDFLLDSESGCGRRKDI